MADQEHRDLLSELMDEWHRTGMVDEIVARSHRESIIRRLFVDPPPRVEVAPVFGMPVVLREDMPSDEIRIVHRIVVQQPVRVGKTEKQREAVAEAESEGAKLWKAVTGRDRFVAFLAPPAVQPPRKP